MSDKDFKLFFNEYVKTGRYFSDAKIWYKDKYVAPFSQRSLFFVLNFIAISLLIGIIYNLYNLLPTIVQVRYAVNTDGIDNKVAKVIRSTQLIGEEANSVASILLKNYIQRRENYEYDKLKEQFLYIKNNSTKVVFRRFYNYMNIDNPTSPVLKYKKNATRSAETKQIKYLKPGVVQINFTTAAFNNSGEKIEDAVWNATINYEIDTLEQDYTHNSRFNFTVTDYQLNLLEDKILRKK